MPVQRTHCADGFVERDGDRMSSWIWGSGTTKPKTTAQQVDERLLAEIQAANGMPRVISLLEEIRDRLAGARPVIHMPTADECQRFGMGVR